MLLSNTFYHGEDDIAMTTDEIAAAVQAGEADTLELWRAVERFVWKMARRKIASLDGKRGVDVFDLAQVGFISMLEALNRFDAAKGGSFIGQLSMSLTTGFAEATGSRTARAFNEPLDNSISIETPLTDEENGDVLGDLIIDPAAELAFDDVSEADRVQRLHEALETALETLPEPQKTAIVKRYYMDEKADSKALNAALRALRHPSISRYLRGFL